MSEKIKIALLGGKGNKKKYLEYFILEKERKEDTFSLTKKNKKKSYQTNQNDKFEILEINIEGSQEKEGKEIKAKMFHFKPHMSLVVIDREEKDEIKNLVEWLVNITGKASEDFLVVLPLSMKSDPTTEYPFTGCSLSELFKKLSEVYPSSTVPTTNRTPSGNIAETERGDHDRIKIVLLGQQGSGKSACGNTILGKTQTFRSRPSSMPVTKKCQVHNDIIFGVTVIDTPDFFHENMESPEFHMRECRKLCQSGSCVYLLVMQASRFTDGERDIFDKLAKAVDPKIREKTIILFTGGEEVDADANTDMGTDALKRTFPDRESIFEQCDDRFHVFKNKSPDRRQVETLMKKVQALIKGPEQGKDQREDQDMPQV